MLEEHILPFLDFLREQRYARMSIQICRIASGEFAMYLESRVQRPDQITEEHLRGYLGIRAKLFPHFWKRPMLPDYQARLASALFLFLRYLGRQGIQTGIPIPHPQDLRAVPGYEKILDEYQRFLSERRGLSRPTVEGYVDHASRLCRFMVTSQTPSWDTITPSVLYDHLQEQARRLRHLSFQNAQTALRSFFRFLRITGRCEKDLDTYLVRHRTYVLSRVPKIVSLDDLYRLFEDVRDDSPASIRDRAVLLLLTLYGLRIGEIVRLRMEDVRWREQQVILRARKSGKDLVLPLQTAIGRALYEYVERVRPRGTPYREIFLTRRTPRPYPRGSNLGMTLRERFLKLGLKIHPHVLRHTLASRLINNDCPPEWIQILLGHAQYTSTQVYAKVDVAHLREVAANEHVDP